MAALEIVFVAPIVTMYLHVVGCRGAQFPVDAGDPELGVFYAKGRFAAQFHQEDLFQSDVRSDRQESQRRDSEEQAWHAELVSVYRHLARRHLSVRGTGETSFFYVHDKKESRMRNHCIITYVRRCCFCTVYS